MIKRGMDVKDLVNSQLFFAEIWKRHRVYACNKDPVMAPYNGDLDDLEFEDPKKIFSQIDTLHEMEVHNHVHVKDLGSTKHLASFMRMKTMYQQDKSEVFEMQYNYIYMDHI